jgi:two-component system, chemotaxis family, sensor kinase CheA
MPIIFDITEEELPIFLAEADEHLQVLDDTLIRLEKESSNADLVQTVFRSAHTIKGMSGMIGHQRMTNLTHALETVLDGVRKNSIQITKQLINICLDAVDHLRLLRDEVSTSQACDLDIDQIVLSLKDFSEERHAETLQDVSNGNDKNDTDSVGQEDMNLKQKIKNVIEAINTEASIPVLHGRAFQIQAKIDANSVASAARAFQLLMALQDLGDIQAVTPSPAQIETASAVRDFSAVLVTTQSFEKISAALTIISDIDEVSIDGALVMSNGSIVSESPQKTASEPPQQLEKIEAGSKPASQPASVMASERRSVSPLGRRNTDMTIRANVERLDNLMNLVGELITDRNQLKQILSRFTRLNNNFDRISETITHLARITDQIQDEVMHIRMLPISSAFGKFPRMVRDMSQKIGKPIDVVIRGEETEMDRSMIEEINDPLIHLVRNSVDHGIESPEERLAAGKPERGTITLTARHEQGRIILTVEDDGGGIDGEKLRKSAVQKGLISAEEAAGLTEEQSINLMFMAGLSTSKKITDISGRGVGLDIVNTNIQHVNGSIQVETKLGHGTQFQIILPLTLAIVPALMVRVRQVIFAIPLVMVTETLRIDPAEIKYVYRKPVTMLRKKVLSLIYLSDIFNIPKGDEERKHLFAVIVQSGRQRVGLIVDSLVGEEDVVVKPLGAFIGDIPGISSAAILSEGQVALIVDVFGLFKLAGF